MYRPTCICSFVPMILVNQNRRFVWQVVGDLSVYFDQGWGSIMFHDCQGETRCTKFSFELFSTLKVVTRTRRFNLPMYCVLLARKWDSFSVLSTGGTLTTAGNWVWDDRQVYLRYVTSWPSIWHDQRHIPTIQPPRSTIFWSSMGKIWLLEMWAICLKPIQSPHVTDKNFKVMDKDIKMFKVKEPGLSV